MKETWKEKFELAWNNDFDSDYSNNFDPGKIKDFISKEIESAKKVERERIVEALEGLKLETDIFYSKCTPIQVLDQVINLINK